MSRVYVWLNFPWEDKAGDTAIQYTAQHTLGLGCRQTGLHMHISVLNFVLLEKRQDFEAHYLPNTECRGCVVIGHYSRMCTWPSLYQFSRVVYFPVSGMHAVP